jgi:hypothetical protein
MDKAKLIDAMRKAENERLREALEQILDDLSGGSMKFLNIGIVKRLGTKP